MQLARLSPGPLSLRPLGPSTRAFLVVAALVLASGALAFSPVGSARTVQFLVLTGLMVLVSRQLIHDRRRMLDFWIWARRGLWALAVVATALSQLALSWPSPTYSLTSADRYAWLAMHPISTGNLLGLVVITLAGSHLLLRDPLFDQPRAEVLRVGLLLGSAYLLLATKSRGSLAATTLGVLLLVALTPRLRTRRRSLLLTLGMAFGVLAMVLTSRHAQEVVANVVTRGQSREQMVSLTGRVDVFRFAWSLFQERPLFGHGYMAGRSLFLEAFPWAGHGHNLLVEIAVSLGVVGLLAFAFLVLGIAGRLRLAQWQNRYPQGYGAREAIPLLAFLLVVGVVGPSFAGTPGHETVALVWTALLADWGSAASRSPAKSLTSQRLSNGASPTPSTLPS
ncbi:MAG: O-antigen ligase family protein [Actinomycetota bacterium]|nr:O-antigen ligase family protein [Actinomycetota bacterium]